MQTNDNSDSCKQKLTCWLYEVLHHRRQSFTYLVRIGLHSKKGVASGEAGGFSSSCVVVFFGCEFCFVLFFFLYAQH